MSLKDLAYELKDLIELQKYYQSKTEDLTLIKEHFNLYRKLQMEIDSIIFQKTKSFLELKEKYENNI